jgi:CMP-N,N'-diacetyllegionaminic acid synthase
MRPDDLATDEASSNDVVLHALEMIGQKYDIVLVLQPTSPLRKAEDIDHALAFMDQKKAPALVSVCKSNKPLYWHHTVENNGTLKPVFHSNTIITNRQEMPPTYIPNGALYIAVADYFKDKKTFYTDATLAYIMPPERSVDIDNSLDFLLAKSLIR